MRSRIGTFLVSSMLFGLASVAHADKIHLVDGAVIEGKARFVGDKVIIALDSGELTLDRGEVERIEQAPTVTERMAALEAKEERRGIAGWLVLANFCRDEGLRTREAHWLERVIARDPEHLEARQRLGYVKDEHGERWVKHEELARERELADERARAAAHARHMAALELEAQRVALERDRLRLQREREAEVEAPPAHGEGSSSTQVATPYAVYGGYAPHAYREPCERGCRPRAERRSEPFPIPGVRDPRDPSWRIPGAKDPSGKDRRRER